MNVYNSHQYKINKFEKFRDLYRNYLISNDCDLRRQMNLLLPEIKDIIHNSKVGTISLHVPDRITGGFFGQFDIFDNLFELESLNKPSTSVSDVIDRSIGWHIIMKKKFFLKLFNPLYWLGSIIRLPLLLLGFAGFDLFKIEASWFGKFSKFATLFWVLLQILRFFNMDLSTLYHF